MAGGVMGALADEVAGEPEALGKFLAQDLPKARRRTVFVGAGDSHAAALAGFYASGGRCLALDPYVLASAPEFASGADVYFISVSGRTSSNALAARKVKGHANRTIALTADAESRLAGLTDLTVVLPMTYAPRTTGMLSFGLSLLGVLKVVGAVGSCDFALALKNASKEALAFSEGGGTTYFLGNALGYPAALYAAAKAHEVLGARAHAELLEEFSRLELFSLEKQDAVNGFHCFDPSGAARRLDRALTGSGYESRAVPAWGRSPAERLFHAVFSVQVSVLERASKVGLTAPAFLSARKALDTSDAMIY